MKVYDTICLLITAFAQHILPFLRYVLLLDDRNSLKKVERRNYVSIC